MVIINPLCRCFVDDAEAYSWESAAWTPPVFDSYIIYEMHIGSFTPEGTFAAAMAKLDHLAATGFTCIQVGVHTGFRIPFICPIVLLC
jgi:1,4-alpha-glucan branching enzyme